MRHSGRIHSSPSLNSSQRGFPRAAGEGCRISDWMNYSYFFWMMSSEKLGSDQMSWPLPRIEAEELPAARLEPEPLPALRVSGREAGTLSLLGGGLAVLALGFAGLEAVNFVAAEFARSPALGALTLAVALGGSGLIGAGCWRELRGLIGLGKVDRLRAALAGVD